MTPSHASEDPGIEALRGFAALMVVATHYVHLVVPQPGLWAFASTGVDLFFVLSGFVFAPYFFGKSLQVGPHLVRRFFRMYPLYLCALLCYALLKGSAGNPWQHIGVHLMMAHTLQSQDIAFFYNPAFWSLPPEIEFYLLLPCLALMGKRVGLLSIVVAALVAHMALVYLASPGEAAFSARAIATVHLPGLLIEFLLGSAAYALAKRNDADTVGHLSMVVGGCGALGVLAALYVFSRYLVQAEPPTAVPLWVSGNMGLIAAVGYALITATVANRAYAAPPMIKTVCYWAGRLSFGLYLLHNAALTVTGLAVPGATGELVLLVALGLSLGVAWLGHKIIEAPCRNFGRGLSQKMADNSTGQAF
jgi:peptidoglycan/LPS O-acetylase OafA/YrhL